MTREEFLQKLMQLGIEPQDVLAENSVSDGYGLRKNHPRWEIFRRERGVEHNTRGFPSESDALQSLLEEISG